MPEGYETFGFYLNNTHRKILYSCSWPAYTSGHTKTDYQLIAKHCNIWRNYNDIQVSIDKLLYRSSTSSLLQDCLIPSAIESSGCLLQKLLSAGKKSVYDQRRQIKRAFILHKSPAMWVVVHRMQHQYWRISCFHKPGRDSEAIFDICYLFDLLR